MADIVDRETVSEYVGPGHDAEAVTRAHGAAEAYIAKRCRVPREHVPADLQTAVCMQTARLLVRRQSPTGLTEMGDLGAARIPVIDRDVETLMAPYRKTVV